MCGFVFVSEEGINCVAESSEVVAVGMTDTDPDDDKGFDEAADQHS